MVVPESKIIRLESEEYEYKLKGDTLLIIPPVRKFNGVNLREHTLWIREQPTSKVSSDD